MNPRSFLPHVAFILGVVLLSVGVRAFAASSLDAAGAHDPSGNLYITAANLSGLVAKDTWWGTPGDSAYVAGSGDSYLQFWHIWLSTELSNLTNGYASSAGNAATADKVNGYGSSPDNSHPGSGARPFYSWNIGQANNATAGYSNGITIGSHPGDPNYGFQIVENMWDDQLYFRRYNYGWQSWRTVIDSATIGSQNVNYANHAGYAISLYDNYTGGQMYNYNGRLYNGWLGDSVAVNYANSAGSLSNMNISQFTNNSGYITSANDSTKVAKTGDTMSGTLTVNGSASNWAGIFYGNGPYGIYTNNTSGYYSQLAAGTYGLYTNGYIWTSSGISARQFNGSGAGLTGTASSLSVGSAAANVYRTGDTMSGSLIFSQGSATRNVGVIGSYDPTRLAAIWSMGSSYQLGTDGSAGNLYGLSYSYEPNYGASGNNPGAIAGLGHQMQWRSNGATQTAIGSGIWTAGNLTVNGSINGSGALNMNGNNVSGVGMITAGYVYAPGGWVQTTSMYTGTINATTGVYDSGYRVYSPVNPPSLGAGSWVGDPGVTPMYCPAGSVVTGVGSVVDGYGSHVSGIYCSPFH